MPAQPRIRMAANPAGGVGAVAGYTTSDKVYYDVIDVDDGGTAVTTHVVSGSNAPGGFAGYPWGITYVNSNGHWDPVITVERVISETTTRSGKTSRHTALDVYERNEKGWQDTGTVLERDDPVVTYGDQGGFFERVELFTKPGGTILGLVAAHCGLTLYAERQSDGSWKYWDVGQGAVGYAANTRVAFSDGQGVSPVLARLTAYNGVIQINHPDLTLPSLRFSQVPKSCANVVTTLPSAWQSVAGVADTDLTYLGLLGVAGLAEQAGNTYLGALAAQPNEKSVDQRIIYRCANPDPIYNDTNWHVTSIDRTNGDRAVIGPVLDGNGGLLRAYTWGNQATGYYRYASAPTDYVFLARQRNNLCY